jgi:TRAP-type transport system periplasmic protein
VKNTRGILVAILLVLSLIGILLSSACSSPSTTAKPAAPVTSAAPAPATSAAPAPATSAAAPKPSTSAAPAPASSAAPATSAAAVKVIEWKFAAQHAPITGVAKIDQAFADRVFEKSGGKLKITTYFSESLLKYAELYRGVQSGVADCAYYAIGTNAGLTELNKVLTLPFMGFANMSQATSIQEKLWAKYPEMLAEFQGMKVLGPRSMPANHFHTTGKQVLTPADIKGMKCIASATTADQLQMAGATPVSLGIGDWYTSLERGLVEGQFTHYAVLEAFKTLDLLKYHDNFGDFGAQTSLDCYIFNQKSWDSIGPDLQKVVEEAVQWRVKAIVTSDENDVQHAKDSAKAKGHVTNMATADQLKQWSATMAPYQQKWVADTVKAGGKNAQAIFDDALKMIQEANAAPAK